METCCIGSKRHNRQLSPLKRSLCFHPSFSLSCSASSHLSSPPSVRQSILALKYLSSPPFSHPAPPATMVRRDRPLQRQKDQKENEREPRKESFT